MTVAFYPLLPGWAIVLVTVLAVVVVARQWRYRHALVSRRQHVLLASLRSLAMLGLLLFLLSPGKQITDANLERSHLVFLLDRSASMATADLPHGQTRLAAATELLASAPWPQLRDYPRHYYSFASEASAAAKPQDLRACRANGGTDLQAAITQLDRDVGLTRISGIVLVSDGLDLSELRGTDLAVPVYSLAVGTDLAQVPDLGLATVKAPAKLSRGEEFELELGIRLSGYTQRQLVKLHVQIDQNPPEVVPLELVAGEARQHRIRHAFDAEGVHHVHLRLEALADEVTLLNNERLLAIEVVKAHDEVVGYFPLLTTSVRPFLREFAAPDDIGFTACYRLADTLYRLRGNRITPGWANGIPAQATAMAELSAVILGAHDQELLSRHAAQTLEEYVSAGGTLIMLAGPHSFGRVAPESPLERLSPVLHLDNSFQGSETFVPQVPAARQTALATGLRALLTEPVQAQGINHVRDIKAGAEVVLETATTALPLLVWQPYGRGKVVALLTNSVHLWGPPAQRDRVFGVFWRQLLAFARNTANDADVLRVALNASELTPTQPVTVTATVNLATDQLASARVAARLLALPGGEPVQTLALTERGAASFVGELAPLPVGRYVLEVELTGAEKLRRHRYLSLIVGDSDRERARLAVSRDLFRRFSSDRHIYSLAETERLQADLLQAVTRNTTQRELLIMFATPLPLLLWVLLLILEWTLRRRYNLF